MHLITISSSAVIIAYDKKNSERYSLLLRIPFSNVLMKNKNCQQVDHELADSVSYKKYSYFSLFT